MHRVTPLPRCPGVTEYGERQPRRFHQAGPGYRERIACLLGARLRTNEFDRPRRLRPGVPGRCAG